MIAYFKLWDVLTRRGMKRTDLIGIIAAPTLAKMGKNAPVNLSIINRLCEHLQVQPGDIMEWQPDSKNSDQPF